MEGRRTGTIHAAALQSPPTGSSPADDAIVAEALRLFSLSENDLDERLPPAFAEAGAYHLVLALSRREALRDMRYDFEAGRKFMTDAGFTTATLVHAETPQLFHVRNPFAAGGVYEDPATGAAAAAFAGYLRDRDWPHGGVIDLIQGEDMGMRSLLRAEITAEKGASIRVSGTARPMA